MGEKLNLKKQNQRESEGPVAEVIRNIKFGKKNCIASDYIEALYAVFRRVEKLLNTAYNALSSDAQV